MKRVEQECSPCVSHRVPVGVVYVVRLHTLAS